MVVELWQHSKGQLHLQNKGSPPQHVGHPFHQMGWGGVKVCTHSECIRLVWNVWNLRHPGVGASTLSIYCTVHLAGPSCITVPICREKKPAGPRAQYSC